MYFDRDVSKRLKNLSTHFKVLVVTGARQTGKTTLLKNLFPKRTLVSLDLPADAALAEESPREFLTRYPPPLVVDEVQYAPGLFRHLKAVVDASAAKGQFVLTGSQRFVLMKEISESLAGRAAIVEMHGLSARELGDVLSEQLKRDGLGGVLARGAYPALWENTSTPVVEFYRSYVATWLGRDLRQLLNVGALRDFERFLRACAARSGQLLNKSDLARDAGVASSTAAQWLSVLEASGLVVLLEPWFSNATKRIVKAPKLYFTDTGLLTFLLGLDARALKGFAGMGSLWETYVLTQLLSWKEAHHPEASVHFYRDKEGLEVDFVVNVGGVTSLLDAKLSEIPAASEAKNIYAAEAKLKIKARKALVTPSTQSFPLGKSLRGLSGFHVEEFFEF